MFKQDCNKNGHRFEARYDITQPDLSWIAAMKSKGSFEIAPNKKYIHDICTRCGFIMQKSTQKTGE